LALPWLTLAESPICAAADGTPLAVVKHISALLDAAGLRGLAGRVAPEWMICASLLSLLCLTIR